MVVTETVPDGPRGAVLAAGHRLVRAKGSGFTTQELVREAGVSLDTFYRHFGGKDQLLVALIGEQILEQIERLRAGVEGVAEPVERLRSHIRMTLAPLPTEDAIGRARFITTEHYRLQQVLPADLAAAIQPFADLIAEELRAGQVDGTLAPRDPERDALLIAQSVLSAFHHDVLSLEVGSRPGLADNVEAYCLAAVGHTSPAPKRRRAGLRRS